MQYFLEQMIWAHKIPFQIAMGMLPKYYIIRMAKLKKDENKNIYILYGFHMHINIILNIFYNTLYTDTNAILKQWKYTNAWNKMCIAKWEISVIV